ncbi:MAG: hypothetical protein P1P89_13795 [Desulfobacterales bacterium]|nr:hypothetical protein [Desulfobacterales bacterium]
MAWTAANPVSVGDPTKKTHYDALWDNAQYNKDTFEVEHSSAGGHNKTGMVLQTIEATPYTTVTTSTASFPYDNTIPQQSEGVELLNVTITPGDVANRLRIEVELNFLMANINCAVALFQDSGANAIAVATEAANNMIVHEMAAGTTSPTTFKLRIGKLGAGTIWLNQSSAAVTLGGASALRMRVIEIKG